MGRRTNEIDDGNEAIKPVRGGSDSGTLSPGAVPLDHTDDSVSDASFSEGVAGAAFHDSMIGSSSSESMVSAPYAENVGDDPYGEQTGRLAEASNDFGDASMETAPDADDEELQANRVQIEQTRADLSDTIDAIQHKLSPANLAGQAKETVRDATIGKAQNMVSNVSETAHDAVSNVSDSAKGAGTTLVETIRQNPIPAALAGIGLGWLVVSMRKNASTESGYRYDRTLPYAYREDYASGRAYGTEQSYGSANDGGTVDHIQGRASDLANQTQDRVSNLAGQAQDKASQVAGAASQTAEQAQVTVRRTTNSITTMMQENPLGVGAAAIALGMVTGLAIPETAKEDQLMGEARESLTTKAQQTVQQTAQKVQDVAQEAVSAGKQEAQDQNLM